MYGLAATKDVPDNPCSTVYANMIPSCWGWLTNAVYGNNYPLPPLPPPAPAVAAGTSTVPAPYTSTEYNAALDASIAAQAEAARQQNLSFFSDVNDVVNKPPAGPDLSGIPWWWWLVGGVGVFGIVALGGGSSRRYGR